VANHYLASYMSNRVQKKSKYILRQFPGWKF